MSPERQSKGAGVDRVIAHTLPEASLSTSVLTTCGFEQTALVSDPDGDEDLVWRWELLS